MDFLASFTDVIDLSLGLTLYRILEVNEKLEVIRMRIWEKYVSFYSRFFCSRQCSGFILTNLDTRCRSVQWVINYFPSSKFFC